MTLSDFKRWLYRGHRPNWIARVLNRAWAAVASSGFGSNYLVTLEVTGRKSRRTISLPLVMAVVDGHRYFVSMLGDDVRWVQNVRAAGGRAVLRRGGREEIQLEEVPADQRAPILKAYLQRAPGSRPHVPVNKDATLVEFQKVAAAFPVFRLASNKTSARLHARRRRAGMQILKAGVFYFAVVFGAGFLLGPVRILWVVPRLGTRVAELLEAPIMFGITIVAARWFAWRLAVPFTPSSRLWMGGIALSLLLIPEFTLVLWLRGLSIRAYLAARDPVAATVYYVMLGVVAVMPLLVARRHD